MSDNVYERIHRVLSWKRIVAFNAVLFLVLVVPISVRLSQEDTENRSGAAEEIELPPVTPPPAYPALPPTIERVSMFFGKKGDTVVILGNNFGEYRWESKVYVGNVLSPETGIVRWGNNVIEVQIPDGARTGKVWVAVNGKQAIWEGSLLLTDIARSAQVGLTKESPNTAKVWVSNAGGVVRGMIEIGHVSEPVIVSALIGSITSQSQSVDSLGKKLRVEFDLQQAIASPQTELMRLEYPGIGQLEILRVELYDQQGKLINVYADPFNVKVQ